MINMADLDPTKPSADGEEIVNKNMHATDAPLADSVAAKIGIKGNMHATTEPIDGTAGATTNGNMHATTEPAN
ncbi:hypothetical protein AB9128_25100 [Streptomyces cinereoruber]|uniref:hypothetical protein n=1 Tax=Streptomyces TaxID=1883 RepID=UPI001F095073|nr:hypothetical protein [Streptomyces sp. S1]